MQRNVPLRQDMQCNVPLRQDMQRNVPLRQDMQRNVPLATYAACQPATADIRTALPCSTCSRHTKVPRCKVRLLLCGTETGTTMQLNSSDVRQACAPGPPSPSARHAHKKPTHPTGTSNPVFMYTPSCDYDCVSGGCKHSVARQA